MTKEEELVAAINEKINTVIGTKRQDYLSKIDVALSRLSLAGWSHNAEEKYFEKTEIVTEKRSPEHQKQVEDLGQVSKGNDTYTYPLKKRCYYGNMGSLSETDKFAISDTTALALAVSKIIE